jgi:hypothetical protein
MLVIKFLPEFHAPIRAGTKTKTCRTKAYGARGSILRVQKLSPTDPALFIRLLDVQRVSLQRVAELDFREEGCASPLAFVQKWEGLHPRTPYDPELQVWLHTFEVADEPDRTCRRCKGEAMVVVPCPDCGGEGRL